MPQFAWPHGSKPGRGAWIDPAHPLARGLVCAHPYNDGAGPTAADATTGGLAMTWQEPAQSWGSGPDGIAGTFLDGVNYGSTPQVFAVKQPYSIACRIYTAQASATTAGLISLGNSATSGQPLHLLQQNGTTLRVLVAGVAYRTLVPAVVAGRWYTISSSWDGATEAHYVDGVLVYSGADAGATVAVAIKLFAGTGSAAAGKGGIAWDLVYNRALPAAEHQRLAAAPWAMYGGGPLRSWAFLQGTGALAGQSSGGLVVGGIAVPSAVFRPPSSGGPVAGGLTAAPSVAYSSPSGGGPVAGGSFAPSALFAGPSSGGPILGGSFAPSVQFVGASAGGVLLGGLTAQPAIGGAVAYAGIDVLSAIHAWWLATGSTQLATSDKNLWHKAAHESTDLPYATIFLVSERAETWTTNYPFMRSSVQVNCHASTDVAARRMALAVRNGLARAPLLINGSPICHILPDADGMVIGQGLGPGGKDCWIAFEVFDIAWTP